MARSTADLQAMRDEIATPSYGVALVNSAANDASNAALINATNVGHAPTQVNRFDIPADEVRDAIDQDEYDALTDQADKDYLELILQEGASIDGRPGAEERQGLIGIFTQVGSPNTYGNLTGLIVRDGSLWERMVQDGVLTDRGDWDPSEVSAARQS